MQYEREGFSLATELPYDQSPHPASPVAISLSLCYHVTVAIDQEASCHVKTKCHHHHAARFGRLFRVLRSWGLDAHFEATDDPFRELHNELLMPETKYGPAMEALWKRRDV